VVESRRVVVVAASILHRDGAPLLEEPVEVDNRKLSFGEIGLGFSERNGDAEATVEAKIGDGVVKGWGRRGEIWRGREGGRGGAEIGGGVKGGSSCRRERKGVGRRARGGEQGEDGKAGKGRRGEYGRRLHLDWQR
jgi:hypothetical protein